MSSPEIAGEFRWPLALIENPVSLSFKAAIANEDSSAIGIVQLFLATD